jgi:hypothetical protein
MAILPRRERKQTMTFKHLSFGAGLAALALVAVPAMPAAAETDPDLPAVKACTTADIAQSAVAFVASADDGRGGSLVWLTDEDANLWLCNADAEGRIFALSQMSGDLLDGAGAHLVDLGQPTDDGEIPVPEKTPITVAEQACQVYLSDHPGKIVGNGPDGLEGDWVPGYYFFIETSEGLCDATGDAQVWALAEIGDPLSLGNPVG